MCSLAPAGTGTTSRRRGASLLWSRSRCRRTRGSGKTGTRWPQATSTKRRSRRQALRRDRYTTFSYTIYTYIYIYICTVWPAKTHNDCLIAFFQSFSMNAGRINTSFCMRVYVRILNSSGSVDPSSGSVDPSSGSVDPSSGSVDPSSGSVDPRHAIDRGEGGIRPLSCVSYKFRHKAERGFEDVAKPRTKPRRTQAACMLTARLEMTDSVPTCNHSVHANKDYTYIHTYKNKSHVQIYTHEHARQGWCGMRWKPWWPRHPKGSNMFICPTPTNVSLLIPIEHM
jgi:hypothetical protein